MTTIDRLDQWRQAEIITQDQHVRITSLVRKDRFSVFLELNALLYIGVISLVAGIGWTVQKYFNAFGDVLVLASLSMALAASFYYCFTRGPNYSKDEVESPNLLLDYVLYFGCLLLSAELAYLEFRFQLLQEAWNDYLLFSTVVFFGLAYRFDNRLVLSLGLSSLAAWFGLTFSRFRLISDDSMRVLALLYAAFIALTGAYLHRKDIKRHFLETYLHVAANVAFIALISGLSSSGKTSLLLPLIVLSVAAIVLGVRYRRFAFVVYGSVFGYFGISVELLRVVRDFEMALIYFIITGTAMVVSMVYLARKLGREE